MLCDWKQFRDAPTQFHNTPNCWSIYMAGLNFKYMKKLGGVDKLKEIVDDKTKELYDYIDNSDGFYTNPVDVRYRSRLNVPFRVKCDNDLETKFLKEATAAGLLDLKGHRLVGGCRASVYSAMPKEGVRALISFMKKFRF